MPLHSFKKEDIPVNDPFIEKFAKMYIDQRSQCASQVASVTATFLFQGSDFDSTALNLIIKKNAVAEDLQREAGLTPAVLNDIYRSDLGELLLTYYFEEKLPEPERFVIPLKNITYRELAQLPGRGLDAIGYRVTPEKIVVLIGEAKVSDSKTSPPNVVHSSPDSIYKTHLSKRKEKKAVIAKLTDYARRLSLKDALVIGTAILAIEKNNEDKYDIVFGCALVRDFKCVNEATDFGKLKSDCIKFERHMVSFALLSFKEATIKDTVDMFYKKVKELAA